MLDEINLLNLDDVQSLSITLYGTFFVFDCHYKGSNSTLEINFFFPFFLIITNSYFFPVCNEYGYFHVSYFYSSGSSRVSRPLISDDIRHNMTEVFLDRMLTSARYLHSSQDYKFWLKRKVQFMIKEGQCQDASLIFYHYY